MPTFVLVDGERAGPAALGVLAPPAARTLLILRPRALPWDLVLVALGPESADPGPFLEVPHERAAPLVARLRETLEGWSETTAGARSWAELPAQAVKYVRYIEELIGAPVALLSTSPERADTILVVDPFQD